MADNEEKSDAQSDEKEPFFSGSPNGSTASYNNLLTGRSSRIGPYKLLGVLGEGGYGVVYLAERQKPIKRRVALKVIKPGMDTKQVIARFEAERQALALFDHPNIAQVFNVGTTKAKRPYFAMEYVKGVPITEHCDRQKLTIDERLELFLQVCEAIQYAHQKGIIHRDIKPSNILVSIEGNREIPKVIDFGVAKAISQPLTNRTLYTEEGQFIGTPEYMSPEQANLTVQDIDTRSDIYSLGIVLYELLTGTLPFDSKTLRKGGIDNIRRIIYEEDPKTPSTRLSSLGEDAKTVAKNRRTEIRTLAKCLQKELEWIPLKAMRKERKHRYRSASELADDIRNYLTGAPLIAGPQSVTYRVKKFVHKRRRLVGTAVIVATALMVGLVVSTIMYLRAERQAEIYRRALYRHQIATAASLYQEGNITRSQELLKSCPPDLRGWEWDYLSHIQDEAQMTFAGHQEGVESVALSPDGKLIASASKDWTIKIWETSTGQEINTLKGHNYWVWDVVFR